jgi:hypothetical protein
MSAGQSQVGALPPHPPGFADARGSGSIPAVLCYDELAPTKEIRKHNLRCQRPVL